MLATFDPTLYPTPPACWEALKSQGITVSQRLAARIFALGQSGIQFSLALLEEAQQPGDVADLLMRREWLQLEPGQSPDWLDEDLCVSVASDGQIQVVTPDEAWMERKQTSTGLVPVSNKALITSVLNVPVTAIRPSVLWNRDRLDQALLNLLDSVEINRLIEDFRYLFRALLTHGQDPTPLLVTALRRNVAELNEEVATAVYEKLDRERGRVLQLLQDDESVRHALKALEAQAENFGPRVTAILLRNLWSREEFRSEVLRTASRLPILAEDADAVRELYDLFWDELSHLVPGQRGRLTEVFLDWGKRLPELQKDMRHRLEADHNPDQQAFALNLLTQLDPGGDLIEPLRHLFYVHGHRSGMLERLKPILLRLGQPAYLRLLEDERRKDASGPHKAWLVHTGHSMRSSEYYEMLMEELIGHSKAVLLALIRTDGLKDQPLVDRLSSLEGLARKLLLDFLVSEAERLEHPDNLPVFGLVNRLGREGLERNWGRLQEEAALGKGSAALTLERVSFFAEQLELSQDEISRMVEDALSFSAIYSKEALFNVWLGLGRLGGYPTLPAELANAVVDKLLEEAAHMRAQQLQALALVHKGAADPVRARIEDFLLEEVASDQKDYRKLGTALRSWEEIVSYARLPLRAEQLAASLAKTLLWLKGDDTVQSALMRALKAEGEDDGTRHRQAWDREDRNNALRVLGKLALHPDLPPTLRGVLEGRIFSFLEDWMQAIEKSRSIYDLRLTPLFDLGRELLASPHATARVADLAVSLSLKILELHNRSPLRLDLRHREDTQRFMVEVIVRDLGAGLKMKGTTLDLPRQLVELLIEITVPDPEGFERPVSLYFLRVLEERPGLRKDLLEMIRLARRRLPAEFDEVPA